MRLIVTDTPIDNLSIDMITMGTLEFNTIETQPFIASSKFDEVVIDVTDSTNINIVKNLMRVTRVIPRFRVELTPHMVTVLTELYKERAAEIRFTYMKDKDKFKTLLESMKQQYCWEQFY